MCSTSLTQLSAASGPTDLVVNILCFRPHPLYGEGVRCPSKTQLSAVSVSYSLQLYKASIAGLIDDLCSAPHPLHGIAESFDWVSYLDDHCLLYLTAHQWLTFPARNSVLLEPGRQHILHSGPYLSPDKALLCISLTEL